MLAEGIDISHHQGSGWIHWPTLSRWASFVFVRATYGTRPDKMATDHIAAAKAAGLRVGGYHFFRQSQDPAEQAEAFIKELDRLGCDDSWLPPVIDIEENKAYDGELDPARYLGGCRVILDALLERYGCAILYVTQADWRRIGKPDWFSDPRVLLWVAHWTKQPTPAVPTGATWAFWQRSVEKKPGTSGPVDFNVFNGTKEELPRIGDAAGPKTDPAPPHEPSMFDLMNVVLEVRGAVEQLATIGRDLTNELLQLRRHVDEQFDRASVAAARTEARVVANSRRLDDHDRRISALEESRGARHG